MNTFTSRFCVMIASLALLALVLAPASAPRDALALQPATASIEIHKSACPAGAQDGELYETCHANGLAGVAFSINGPVFDEGVTSGSLGALVFSGLPAGDYTIAEQVMSGDFARYVVVCTVDGISIPVDYRGNGRAAVLITVGDGEAAICDWYNIPAPGQEPADDVDPAGTQDVTTLPGTGAGLSTQIASSLTAAMAALLIATILPLLGAAFALRRV